MRTLDRYIARSFLEPLLVSMGVIVGLLMVAHAFDQLDRFLRVAGTLGDALYRMARIYLIRIPTFIAPILPIAMLVGASFGISQLSSKNELTAMRACGMSLWRILAPLYAVAAILALLGLANCELLVPRIEAMTARDMQRWTGKDEFKSVLLRKPEEKTVFTLSYNVAHNEARSFSITRRDTREHIRADKATYSPGVWHLTNVRRGDEQISEMDWKTSLTPAEIELQLLDPSVAPLNVLKQFIERDPDKPQYVLLYHERLAYPFICIVLVGLGLPFVVGNERIRNSRVLGAGVCLAICGVFYTVRFIATDLGQNGYLPPQVAAWLPTIMFGALGLYLLETVRS